jgi:hypothetical protein
MMDFADAYIWPAIFSIFIVFAVVLGIADLRADRRQQREDQARTAKRRE